MKPKTKWILIGLLILLPVITALAVEPLKKRYQRYICGVNLKRLGTAQTVYANNYHDEYVLGTRSFDSNEVFIPEDPNIPSIAPSGPGL